MSEQESTALEIPSVYLGDGAYASFDGYSIHVYTTDGMIATNEVVMEPEVVAAFLNYIQ